MLEPYEGSTRQMLDESLKQRRVNKKRSLERVVVEGNVTPKLEGKKHVR